MTRPTGTVPDSPPRRRLLPLWAAFVLVHTLLIGLNLSGVGWPLGDVERVYLGWAQGVVDGSALLGINTAFVYPIVALAPILAALAFGAGLYVYSWLGLVTLLNGLAFALLLGRAPSRQRAAAGYWWLVFLALLGPVALARIDSVTVPLTVLALLWLRTRPVFSAVLLTLATWVKVWPVALGAALLIASKQRWRMLAAFAVTSAVIIGLALSFGSGGTVFSFVTEQTDRGLQIEAPVSSWWMWQSVLGVPGTQVYYDFDILTYQVTGAGTELVSALMTPLLAAAIGGILLLGWRAQRAGADVDRLLPVLMLALVLTLIVVNKVGSPQFMTWLAAPIILGLVGYPGAWRRPAALALGLAALTQVIYPYFYNGLLTGSFTMVLVLTVRNLLEVVLLGWMVLRLVRLGSTAAVPAPGPTSSRTIPTVPS